jgi:hypothetical protein
MNGATPVVNFVNLMNSTDSIAGSSYLVDPDYAGDRSTGADLAVVNLSAGAPLYATIYQLYTGLYPAGSSVLLAGFGFHRHRRLRRNHAQCDPPLGSQRLRRKRLFPRRLDQDPAA